MPFSRTSHLEHAGLAPKRRSVQRRAVLGQVPIRVARLHRAPDRRMQEGLLALVGSQQQLHDWLLASLGSQRRGLEQRVAARCVDIVAPAHEQLTRVQQTGAHIEALTVMKRGDNVLAQCVQLQPVQAVHAALEAAGAKRTRRQRVYLHLTLRQLFPRRSATGVIQPLTQRLDKPSSRSSFRLAVRRAHRRSRP